MRTIVVYDDAGNILGRVSFTDHQQAANYPKYIDIDAVDAASAPEQWAEVDLIRKILRPKPGYQDPTGKEREPR